MPCKPTSVKILRTEPSEPSNKARLSTLLTLFNKVFVFPLGGIFLRITKCFKASIFFLVGREFIGKLISLFYKMTLSCYKK